MARQIRAHFNQDPARKMLVLTGNVHASKAKGASFDAEFEPMAYHLRELDPLSLDVRAPSISIWTCGTGTTDCGPETFPTSTTIQVESAAIRLDPDAQPGFDGLLLLKELTPSPPAALERIRSRADAPPSLVVATGVDPVMAQEPADTPAADSALGEELISRAKRWQDVEARFKSAVRGKGLVIEDAGPGLMHLTGELHEVVRQNSARLGSILDQSGWPSKQSVGADGSRAAWLILDHAPLAMQLRYLPLMEVALAAGEIKKSEFATMQDRILVFQNKPQRYGTRIVPRPGAQPRLADIEDVEHLDQRRRLMELPSMDEQLRTYERDLGIVVDRAGLRQRQP